MSSSSTHPLLAKSRALHVEHLEERLTPATSVVTYHHDLQLTGQNLTETVLTPANVNADEFGKLRSIPVNGQVYAQPLYVADLIFTSGTTQTVRDVVYTATMGNDVYAIDSNSGDILWQRSFVNPAQGITTVPQADVVTEDIQPEIGILSTPTIDLASSTIYVVARTKEMRGNDPHFVQTLHALDLRTGENKLGGPEVIADTIFKNGVYTYVSGPFVNGTGGDSVNGRVTYNALRQNQRSALVIHQDTVWVLAASHGDNGPYHGWILGYDKANLELKAVFNSTPNGGQAGIWMGGAGLSVDPEGFMYVATSNGDFSNELDQLDAQGFPINGNYATSILKLTLDPTTTVNNQNLNGWGIKVVDYFTPFDQAQQSLTDLNLGSSGVTILPDSVGSAQHQRLLVAGGKNGKIYLVDRDNMGKFNPNADSSVQTLVDKVNGLMSTPAYYGGTLYVVGSYTDVGKQFRIQNGLIDPTPETTTPQSFLFPGSTPTISASGSENAIVWNLDRGTRQLRAYRADNYAEQLWNSNQAPNERDVLRNGVVKFTTPTVADGKVFVGSDGSLEIFGLFSNPTTLPLAPEDLTATPLSNSQIRIRWIDQSNNEQNFIVESSSNGSAFSTLANLPANTTEYIVSSLQPQTNYSFRVKAVNRLGSSAFSNVASTTTPTNSTGGFSFSSGFANQGGLLSLNGSSQIVGNRLQLTSNSTELRASAYFASPVAIERFSSQFLLQIAPANANAGDGMTFVIHGGPPTAIGTSGGGLGYGTRAFDDTPGIQNSLAIKFDIAPNSTEGFSSTGLYLNGAAPTIPAIDLSPNRIFLGSGRTILVTVTYDNATLTVQIQDPTTGAFASQSYSNVNIASIVGGPTAYIGFTAATGNGTAQQEILNWVYSPLIGQSTPRDLSSIAGPNRIELRWSSVPTATSYNIYRSTSSNTQSNIPYITGVTTNSFVDQPLGNGQTYYYKVSAVGIQGESTRSAETSATTLSFPATPSNQFASEVGTTTLRLNWQENADNESGIRILRRDGFVGTYVNIVELPPNSTTYLDTNLTPGQNYSYHIQAINPLGFADFAGVFIQTLSAAPTNVNAVAVSPTSTVVTWNPSFGATSYDLYRSSSPLITSIVPYAQGITTTSFTDNSVTPGATFYYRVLAVNASGTGPFSPLAGIGLPFSVGSFNQGIWQVDSNNNANLDLNDFSIPFGIAGDVPLWGDWTGTGRERLGVFRRGAWFLDTNGQTGWQGSDTGLLFGIATDLPTPGDWNGDGRADLGVFRNGTWFLDTNGVAGWQGNDTVISFGSANDIPVVGDWNGDGRDEIGTVRGAQWFLDTNGVRGWQGNDTSINFGVGRPTDTPVVGDWNGDGRDEIGVYRTSGQWFLDANGVPGWQSEDLVLAYNIGAASPIVRRGIFSQPLRASAIGPLASSTPDHSDLESTVASAIGLWQGSGVPASTTNTWKSGRISFVDLPDDLLGVALSDRILLDRDAAGWGWFVDPTPTSDEEFKDGKGIEEQARVGIDLLSVVLHELGHAFGWVDDAGSDSDVMGHVDAGSPTTSRGIGRCHSESLERFQCGGRDEKPSIDSGKIMAQSPR
jgi:fibronectin type 3 domain-containing protein